ncbi:DUF2188 domain-containing protein [Synergistaceae bacterium OttesenSCG-928-D05]|nr:DUF2188 domain-containing protein [Synergistaceae bacterium OttesenSCG-928-D05]
MEGNKYYLVHNVHGGWDLKHMESGSVLLHCGTKAEAERRARALCDLDKKELVIFSKDGQHQHIAEKEFPSARVCFQA